MAIRELDEGVVRNKLDAIERARATLQTIGEVDAHKLEHDAVIAAAVERLLYRLVELAVDTNTHISAALLHRAPGDYRESFDLAHDAGALTYELVEEIKPSVSMRNTIARVCASRLRHRGSVHATRVEVLRRVPPPNCGVRDSSYRVGVATAELDRFVTAACWAALPLHRGRWVEGDH